MKVDKYKEVVTFDGEDGQTLDVRYSNRGDPWSEGLSLEFNDPFAHDPRRISLYLEKFEARRLVELFNKIYPEIEK